MTTDDVARQIGLFEAIYTQRAIRSFRPDPVPRALVERLVEAATKAPSAGNRQPWAFVAIDDRELLRTLAGFARAGFEAMLDRAIAHSKPGDPSPFPRLRPMIEAFEQIPVLIVACAEGSPERPDVDVHAGSIFPAVQNLLLAARGLGLGAALTTGWATPHLREIRDLLGVPGHVRPLAFIPVGYPGSERYGPTTRRAVSEVLHWDGWDDGKRNTAVAAHR